MYTSSRVLESLAESYDKEIIIFNVQQVNITSMKLSPTLCRCQHIKINIIILA